MENKHEKKHHGGSAFLWGFILGAIFATLLTTKKGRALLRELINTGMEMIEDFVEDHKNAEFEKQAIQKQKITVQEEKEEVVQSASDLNTGIGEIEVAPKPKIRQNPPEVDEVSDEAAEMALYVEEEPLEVSQKAEKPQTYNEPRKRGSKRRLFKGIRKTKAN